MRFEDFYKLYEEDLKPKLKLNTWRTKDVIFQKKLIPYFKDKKMNEISPAEIIKWQNEMIKKRQADGKPYKPTYLKTMQSELSAIFNHAVRFYNLRENPVKKAGTIGKGKADEMDFWIKEEYLKFIECVKDKPISYYAFQILYWCGIREGELLALTPADIDFKNTKSYQYINGEDIITDPKTEKSRRDVVIPDFLVEELRQFIGMLYGYGRDDRIFQITKSYLHHEMSRGAKAAGVKRIRIHDLRHSHISLHIRLGFSAVAIGNRVGHESQTRSVMLVGRIEGQSNIRAMIQIKNNLAAFGHPKAFELAEDGFHWLGDYEITADEVLSGMVPKASKLEMAKQFLREQAERTQKILSTEIIELAAQEGISKRTLETAKKELKIKAERCNNNWYWNLRA